MNFEYDENKSRSNLEKHGIDLESAQRLWSDEYLLEIPARSKGEERFFCIGKIASKCWTAVITYRKSSIRIISVRRSRKEEESLYDND